MAQPLWRLLRISVVVCVATLMVTSIGLAAYTKHQGDVRREEQVKACERGNLVRMRLNVLLLRGNVQLVPVVDCQTVIR